MSLKTPPSSNSNGESPLHDPWSGLWGSVVPDRKSLSMFRVELPVKDGKKEIHAFDYSGLSRWVCRKTGEEEEVEIYFGKHLVKIKGRGLAKLIDALEEGRLKLLRTCPFEMSQTKPWIKDLTVETAAVVEKVKAD